MKSTRVPDPASSPAGNPAAPVPTDRGRAIEERDWYASSRELAQGLVVVEVVETIPAELRDIM